MGTSIERGVFMKKIPAFNKEAFIAEKKKEFWEKVIFVSPENIKSDEVGIVSDGNVDWLINEAITKAVESSLNEIIDELDLGLLCKQGSDDYKAEDEFTRGFIVATQSARRIVANLKKIDELLK